MKIFETPEIEILKFGVVDVITTSATGDTEPGDEWAGDNGGNNTGWN